MSVARQATEYTDLFASAGYLLLPSVIPAEPLARLCGTLRSEFVRAEYAGELFSGGGMISGHLNCFPGETSRFVHEHLEEAGILELVRTLAPQATRGPNIGCNINLPASHAQNRHVDGYAATPFMIANVAVMDTTRENGAIELYPESHRRD
ncbi:MAG: hypothetical protein RL701_5012, partial [Pseudomonadota bacterium]